MTNSRETTQAIMDAVYNERPQYWPHGLDINQFDPSRGEGVFLVRSKSANMQPIGFVGWQIRKEAGQRIGYYSVGILPEHRGQGYAKEAVAKLINIKSASVDKVIALIEKENGPSKALASSLGVQVKEAALKSAFLTSDDRDAVSKFVELANRVKGERSFAEGDDPLFLQNVLQEYANRGSRALKTRLLGKDAVGWTKLFRDNPINRKFHYTLPWNEGSAEHYTQFLKGPAYAYQQLLVERAKPWNIDSEYKPSRSEYMQKKFPDAAIQRNENDSYGYRQAVHEHPAFQDLRDVIPEVARMPGQIPVEVRGDGSWLYDASKAGPDTWGLSTERYTPYTRDMVLEARRRYYEAKTPEEKAQWMVKHFPAKVQPDGRVADVEETTAPFTYGHVLSLSPAQQSELDKVVASRMGQNASGLNFISPEGLRADTSKAMMNLANSMQLTPKPLENPDQISSLSPDLQSKLVGQNLLDYTKQHDPELHKKLRIISWIAGNESRDSVQGYAGPLKPILTADKIAKGLLLASLVGGAGYLGYNAWKKRREQRKKLDRILRAAEGETKEASSVSPAARLLKLRERKSRRLSPAMRALLYGAGGAAVGGLAGRAAFTDPRSSLLTGALTGLGGAAYGYYDGLADKEFETAADYLAKYASKPTVANVYRKRQLSTISKLLSQ